MKTYIRIPVLCVLVILLAGCPMGNQPMPGAQPMGDPASQFDANGFDSSGMHKDTGTAYNPDGFDVTGHDENGFNSSGVHRDTSTQYDPQGYNTNDTVYCGQFSQANEGAGSLNIDVCYDYTNNIYTRYEGMASFTVPFLGSVTIRAYTDDQNQACTTVSGGEPVCSRIV